MFSTLDLKSGYWQIPLNPKSKHKSSFVCKQGTFEFNVMPCGLCNTPGTFQRVMDSILKPLLGKFVYVFLDDIIVFSKSKEEHISHVKEVFRLLHRYNFKLNKHKCQFNKSELIFLGHVISHHSIRVDKEKVDAINTM